MATHSGLGSGSEEYGRTHTLVGGAPVTGAEVGRQTAAPSTAAQAVASDRRGFYVRTPRLARRLEFLQDIFLIVLGGLVAFLWFAATHPVAQRSQHVPPAALVLLYSVVLVLACRALHLYVRPRQIGMFSDVVVISKSAALTTSLVAGYLYLSRSEERRVGKECRL